MTVHITDADQAVASATDVLAAKPGTNLAGPYRMFFKRALDVSLVLLSAPFVVPFILIVAAFVGRDGHSPFFWQERVGRDGRRFALLKLRTMVPDAERHLQRHLNENPEARAEWEVKQKLTHDPRCTPLGRALRKTSIDELPQLYNVLIGDMSLVGPRPMMPSQQSMYPGHGYYKLRPGITGMWQVSSRNASSFSERAYFDDAYNESLSLKLDIGLLLKTVQVVLRGTGC